MNLELRGSEWQAYHMNRPIRKLLSCVSDDVADSCMRACGEDDKPKTKHVDGYVSFVHNELRAS